MKRRQPPRRSPQRFDESPAIRRARTLRARTPASSDRRLLRQARRKPSKPGPKASPRQRQERSVQEAVRVAEEPAAKAETRRRQRAAAANEGAVGSVARQIAPRSTAAAGGPAPARAPALRRARRSTSPRQIRRTAGAFAPASSNGRRPAGRRGNLPRFPRARPSTAARRRRPTSAGSSVPRGTVLAHDRRSHASRPSSIAGAGALVSIQATPTPRHGATVERRCWR